MNEGSITLYSLDKTSTLNLPSNNADERSQLEDLFRLLSASFPGLFYPCDSLTGSVRLLETLSLEFCVSYGDARRILQANREK